MGKKGGADDENQDCNADYYQKNGACKNRKYKTPDGGQESGYSFCSFFESLADFVFSFLRIFPAVNPLVYKNKNACTAQYNKGYAQSTVS